MIINNIDDCPARQWFGIQLSPEECDQLRPIQQLIDNEMSQGVDPVASWKKSSRETYYACLYMGIDACLPDRQTNNLFEKLKEKLPIDNSWLIPQTATAGTQRLKFSQTVTTGTHRLKFSQMDITYSARCAYLRCSFPQNADFFRNFVSPVKKRIDSCVKELSIENDYSIPLFEDRAELIFKLTLGSIDPPKKGGKREVSEFRDRMKRVAEVFDILKYSLNKDFSLYIDRIMLLQTNNPRASRDEKTYKILETLRLQKSEEEERCLSSSARQWFAIKVSPKEWSQLDPIRDIIDNAMPEARHVYGLDSWEFADHSTAHLTLYIGIDTCLTKRQIETISAKVQETLERISPFDVVIPQKDISISGSKRCACLMINHDTFESLAKRVWHAVQTWKPNDHECYLKPYNFQPHFTIGSLNSPSSKLRSVWEKANSELLTSRQPPLRFHVEKIYLLETNNPLLPRDERTRTVLKEIPLEGSSEYSLIAGELGSGPELLNLGVKYYKGVGVKQDLNKAALYYLKAGELGCGEGFNNLGDMYKKGKGVKQDLNKAALYYLKAGELGCGNGFFNVGVMHYRGKGVEKDLGLAAACFRKAGKLGCGEGFNNLGDMYKKGKGVKQDLNKAAEYFLSAGELGCGPELFNLGVMHYRGKGVEKDLGLAAACFRKAGKLGCAASLYNLGVMHENGEGVKQDLNKAAEYFLGAGELGYGPELFNLGVMHYRGKGVEKDLGLAAACFRKAGKLGCAASLYNLGVMHENGEGVEKDPEKAAAYFLKAKKLGYEF